MEESDEVEWEAFEEFLFDSNEWTVYSSLMLMKLHEN